MESDYDSYGSQSKHHGGYRTSYKAPTAYRRSSYGGHGKVPSYSRYGSFNGNW